MATPPVVGSARPRVRRGAAPTPPVPLESQLLALQQEVQELQQQRAESAAVQTALMERMAATEARLFNIFTHLRDLSAAVIIARSSVGTLRAQETLAELLRNFDDALRDCEDPAQWPDAPGEDDGTTIDTGSVIDFDPTQD